MANGMRLMITPRIPLDKGDLFRSDAKAEGGKATVGGWYCADGRSAKEAAWFFAEITKDNAPWAYQKKDPQRVIATLELLGTLLCLVLFDIKNEEEIRGTASVTGSTDNQGNTFALSKLMSTKWPLTSLLMEMGEQMKARKVELHLCWVRRDSNTEADAITNEDFSAFTPGLRIPVDLKSCSMVGVG